MKIMMRAAAILLALCSPAIADAVRVSDGDTIRVDGVKYRLWGIDAPETHQLCADGWRAGIEATDAMKALVGGRTVICEARGLDRYGRTIGRCTADGVDIQAEMVRAGMAWAFVKYSRDYAGIERAAAAAGLGVHGHDCEKPWDWRAEHRAPITSPDTFKKGPTDGL